MLTHMGRYDEADKELETALGMFVGEANEQCQSVSWSCLALRAISMDERKSALKALQEAEAAAEKWRVKCGRPEPNQLDLVRILWLSGAAKRLGGDTACAEADLNDALSRCRRIRLVEFEADILIEMAKLQWQKAEGKNEKLIDQARSLTREALEIADRCEYRLKQADIHNFLAEMALAARDKATALKHAGIAKERAWCDGPPYCYRKALDQAEQMLAKLQ